MMPIPDEPPKHQQEATPTQAQHRQGPLDALGRQVRWIEKRVRDEGDAYWQSERTKNFDATDLAFLIRSIRSLLLILTTERVVLEDLREHIRHSGEPG